MVDYGIVWYIKIYDGISRYTKVADLMYFPLFGPDVVDKISTHSPLLLIADT